MGGEGREGIRSDRRVSRSSKAGFAKPLSQGRKVPVCQRASHFGP